MFTHVCGTERMREEGIFRLSGNHERVEALRDLYDAGKCNGFQDSEDTHVVAALFKMYFRMLPEPLLLIENYEAIISVCRGALPTLRRRNASSLTDRPLQSASCHLFRFCKS